MSIIYKLNDPREGNNYSDHIYSTPTKMHSIYGYTNMPAVGHNRGINRYPVVSMGEDDYYDNRTEKICILISMIGFRSSRIAYNQKYNHANYNGEVAYLHVKHCGECLTMMRVELHDFMKEKYLPNYTEFLSSLGEENGIKVEVDNGMG